MLLALTPRAVEKVQGFRAGVEDADAQAMWIEVTGVHRGEFTYDLSLKPLAAAGPDDTVERIDDLPVVVPAGDVEALRDALVDWSDDLMRGGLVVTNPNKPSPVVETPTAEGLEGDVAERVAQVLEQHINPAIAMHGGMAQLVGVEGDTAFVRLGGGCQGCGMAGVTLDQGIESAIVGAVPEVSRVVDVTDHASGENPYYEPAAS
ncbi:MAG: Fe/S biosis protein NfuA [Thermoleophilaceae bacterium]|nr:Fe/S biosis protein NfuA [Thermoleophilaceae bacterium]MEA2353681.1 Fe/S biosis protein NfuA [Thermoleophilaceae bacterium]